MTIKKYLLGCDCVLWFYMDDNERFVERVRCLPHSKP